MANMKPHSRYLTKTLFSIANGCPTKMYYYGKSVYTNSRDQDEFLASLAEGGFQVGALAKCYFPEGIEVTSADHLEAVKQTQGLLKRDSVTVFEAAFMFEDFFVRTDVVRKTGDLLELIEVKSKSYHPGEDKFITTTGNISAEWEPYVNDVAFQSFILRKAVSSLRLEPYLMLVDKSTTTSVEGLNQRFRLIEKNGKSKVVVDEGLTTELLGSPLLALVPVGEYVDMTLADERNAPSGFLNRIREYAAHYLGDKRFPITLGHKCKSCEFNLIPYGSDKKNGFRECWTNALGWKDSDFAKPLVLDVWNFRHIQECMDRGIYLAEDIPAEEFFFKKTKKGVTEYKSETTARQHLQIVKTGSKTGGEESVDKQLFEEIRGWTFPLHFIDFETSMVAIPFNKGRRPYELIAFQFSHHSIHNDGRIEHGEWIHQAPGTFPNFDFLRELKLRLQIDDGTIFRYAPHENTVLRHIRGQVEKAMGEGSILPDEAVNLLDWIDSVTEWKEDVHENGKTKEVTRMGRRNMVDM